VQRFAAVVMTIAARIATPIVEKIVLIREP
jgi:hypothetical protein